MTILTHLSRMNFPIPIVRTSLFQMLRVFVFIQFPIVFFCKQTVETLVRHRILQCLIWVSTVCLRPTERKLGLYGLTRKNSENRNANIEMLDLF